MTRRTRKPTIPRTHFQNRLMGMRALTIKISEGLNRIASTGPPPGISGRRWVLPTEDAPRFPREVSPQGAGEETQSDPPAPVVSSKNPLGNQGTHSFRTIAHTP